MTLLLEAARDVTLAQKLKAYRLAAGLTQEQLARLAGPGVRTSTISRIESGQTEHPSYPTLKAIAHALGVEVGQLADEESGVAEAPPVMPLDDPEWLKAAAARLTGVSQEEASQFLRNFRSLSRQRKKLVQGMLEELGKDTGRLESKHRKEPGGAPSEDEDTPGNNLAGKPVAKDYDANPKLRTRS